MLVLCHSPWRLGNRLTLLAHVYAAALDQGEGLVHADFTPYEGYFPRVRERLVLGRGRPGWPRRSLHAPLHRMARVGSRLLARHDLSLPAVELLEAESAEAWVDLDRWLASKPSRPLTLLRGYFFRAPRALARHTAAVHRLLTPDPVHLRRVERLIRAVREDASTLLGVHIRQTDYETFRDGAFYLTLEEYRELMGRLLERFEGEVRFLVCSDIDLAGVPFPGLPVHRGTGHLIEDLEALARCDLLVGPPSSFSRWASFRGGVPLATLTRDHREVTREDFRLDHREPWQDEVGA